MAIYLTEADVEGLVDVAELGHVVQGTGPKRTAATQISLFKSLGIALEDVAFGKLIYDRAVAQGVGRPLDALK